MPMTYQSLLAVMTTINEVLTNKPPTPIAKGDKILMKPSVHKSTETTICKTRGEITLIKLTECLKETKFKEEIQTNLHQGSTMSRDNLIMTNLEATK